MTVATDIRAVIPKHTPKRLASLMGVPLGTAHEWLYRRFSDARRKELAASLLAEMDKQDIERSAIRRRLAAWAAED